MPFNILLRIKHKYCLYQSLMYKELPRTLILSQQDNTLRMTWSEFLAEYTKGA